MEYRKVYFRIRSRYQFNSGWICERDAARFREESRQLFQNAGWQLHPGRSSISDTVTKGLQELYLHPMNFSGVIQLDEISGIQEFLKKADSFRCYGVDYYERGIQDAAGRPTRRDHTRDFGAVQDKTEKPVYNRSTRFEHRSKIFCSPTL